MPARKSSLIPPVAASETFRVVGIRSDGRREVLEWGRTIVAASQLARILRPRTIPEPSEDIRP